jgi:hypothetical protein
VEAILAHPKAADPTAGEGTDRHPKDAPPPPPTPPAPFPEGPYGYEKMLLIVHGSQHDQEVVVRFSGCDYHGTDDGQVERQLTADVLRGTESAVLRAHPHPSPGPNSHRRRCRRRATRNRR